MQYSVKTKEDFGAFRMALEFRFEPEDVAQLPPTFIGNSGIYIYGLYEVQILRTGYFVADNLIDANKFPSGIVDVRKDAHTLKAPMNQFLCASLYGRGGAADPWSGAPRAPGGSYSNACGDDQRWHSLIIEFYPAQFAEGQKTRSARIAIQLDGVILHYGDSDVYELPGPTGSQAGKPETAYGPIVLQDHGSRVSFRSMAIERLD